MKRRWRIWLPFCLLILLAAIGLWLYPGFYWSVVGRLRNEASYQGMPTSYWENELDAWCFGRRRRAFMAEPPVLSGGPETVPVLVELLETKNQIVFRQAARRLSNMNVKPKAAVPVLIRACKSPDVNIRESAAQLLMEIDPVAAKHAGVEERR